MDCKKTGELIFRLRTEKELTQLQLANELSISDKTVSKWERGLGCPDVSLLNQLSRVLNVDMSKLLLGELKANKYNNGNMKRLDFYVCKQCNNILFSLNDAEIHCCGRKIESLVHQEMNDLHKLVFTEVENDLYLEMDHPMSKDHYINFIAYVVDGQISIMKLYPEQHLGLRIPKFKKMNLYIHCNQDGLFRLDV